MNSLKEKILEDIENEISPKRFKHIMGVSETAVKLAKIHGGDESVCEIAGLLHDIAKEKPLNEMQELTKGINLPDKVLLSRALLHGPAGAVLSKERYGISEEIYNACFYHTFGRENMTLTEKIIFVADMIEPGRDFEGLESIRKTAKTNIDRAVIDCINQTLHYLLRNDKDIFEETVKTRNFYLKNMEKK